MSATTLGGLFFQQFWEKKAFELGGSDYAAPAQRAQDFVQGRNSQTLPDALFMGRLKSADLHEALPAFVTRSLANAIRHHANKAMPGLLEPDTLLVGVETRTSAPLRVCRNSNTLESLNVRGLFPLGEGAGYAGGIMTSAVDGVRAAEALLQRTEVLV